MDTPCYLGEKNLYLNFSRLAANFIFSDLIGNKEHSKLNKKFLSDYYCSIWRDLTMYEELFRPKVGQLATLWRGVYLWMPQNSVCLYLLLLFMNNSESSDQYSVESVFIACCVCLGRVIGSQVIFCLWTIYQRLLVLVEAIVFNKDCWILCMFREVLTVSQFFLTVGYGYFYWCTWLPCFLSYLFYILC